MATRGQELKKMSRVLLEQVNEVAREATVRVMNDLAEKKCIPCEGGIPSFDIKEIHKYLNILV